MRGALDLAPGVEAVQACQAGGRRQGGGDQRRVRVHAGQVHLAGRPRRVPVPPRPAGLGRPTASRPSRGPGPCVRAVRGEPATASSSSARGADAAELQRVQRDARLGQVDVGVDEAGRQQRAVQVDDVHGGVGDGRGGLFGAHPGDRVAVDQHRGGKGIGGGVDGTVAVQRHLAGCGGGR